MSLDGDDDEATNSVHRQPRYSGEDISPTTPRELRGWYAYPIAAEVYAVVAVGTYQHHCHHPDPAS
jgi:UMF1 family MFS transporter